MFSTIPKAFTAFYISKINDFKELFTKSNERCATDRLVSGELFRKKSNNQYFRIVDKNTKISDLNSFRYFYPLHFIERDTNKSIGHVFDSKKHMLVRLEIINKQYFVESNQAITIDNPDVTILNMSFEEIERITPEFVPLPQY